MFFIEQFLAQDLDIEDLFFTVGFRSKLYYDE